MSSSSSSPFYAPANPVSSLSSLALFRPSPGDRDVPFRFCLPPEFTRVTPSTLDHGSVVGAFFRTLEHPRKEKPNHHFSIPTPRPITYAYTPGDPHGDAVTCSSDITPNCLAYL